MAQKESSPDSLTDEPWRQTDDYESWDLELRMGLVDEIEKFAPPEDLKVKQVRILVLGPVGGGKSSFFNTISSVFRGHVTRQAASGCSDQSVTSKFRMYQIRNKDTKQPLNFRLCDTMGLEDLKGIGPGDLDYLLEGNVPDGYLFNLQTPIGSDIHKFNRMPTLADKMHCVCFVLDGTTATQQSPEMREKIKSLQARINHKCLPQFILLTKIDKLCESVERDLSNVYKSSKIRDLVKDVSECFGVPRNQILPMKNYESEMLPSTHVSILALQSLREMLRASEDCLLNYMDQMEEV